MSVLPLLLAAFAAAQDLEAGRLNLDTVVRNYVAVRASADDVWTLKRAGQAPLRLRYQKLEDATVHRAAGGRWRGLADFKTTDGKKHFVAEVEADTGGDLWEVKKLRWLGRDETYDLRSRYVKAAKAAPPRRPGPAGAMPELSLADAAGRETFLPECPKARCLTVYVAPWCPACRSSTAIIRELQAHLATVDVPVRVVVGADVPEKVRAYALEFGDATLLDPDKRWSVGGVPHFFVSDAAGGVHKEQAGAYRGLSPAEYAQALGL